MTAKWAQQQTDIFKRLADATAAVKAAIPHTMEQHRAAITAMVKLVEVFDASSAPRKEKTP